MWRDRSPQASYCSPRLRPAPPVLGTCNARTLDTYEDMVADPTQRTEGLQWFATRFSTWVLAVVAPKVEMAATNPREEVHKLLVEQCELVDRLYARLPESDRAKVAVLITEMAASMQRWGATFASQGGTLETDEQLARYCDDVIGEPARFAVALMVRGPLSESQHRRVSTVSELVQLANVTRDIERDLEHGVGYHPGVKPYLGEPATDRYTQEQVRGVREESACSGPQMCARLHQSARGSASANVQRRSGFWRADAAVH